MCDIGISVCAKLTNIDKGRGRIPSFVGISCLCYASKNLMVSSSVLSMRMLDELPS